jgi:pimeloyl-ACP methyl ester carboxylesterase
MKAKTLVVVLHGMSGNPDRLRFVKHAIEGCIPEACIHVPALPLHRLSNTDPISIVEQILTNIDEWWSDDYTRLILVGHSAGALLARKVYICACGTRNEAPLEGRLKETCVEPRRWAGKVDRIILLAGMNNGWSIDYHMSISRGLYFHLGVAYGRIFHFIMRRWPFLFHIRRGAPFLTELRVQWLIMRRGGHDPALGKAPVIQLLGTIDDLVSPRDNVDLVTGADFYFLDMPKSGHANVLEMDQSIEGRERSKVFRDALCLPITELKAASVTVHDVNPVIQQPEVDEVIFVIHGIRDEGFWTERIARAIVIEGKRAGTEFARVTSTYGYFGMLPFVFPWERLKKVEWLMDQYADAIARFPNARRFHCVGHSNGTWLVARALQTYPSCRFSRIVFAGSVVSSRYDWSALLQRGKVGAVLNYAATADWVVACFPNLFEYIRVQDLGGAGHWGFRRSCPATRDKIRNIEFVVGRHSAAIREDNWEDISRFVVSENWPPDPPSAIPVLYGHAPFVAFLGYFPLLAWLFVFVLASVVPAAIVFGRLQNYLPEWFATSALIAYFSVLFFVGRRV